MDSGKHVYEKPLALNNDDAKKMFEKSKEMNVNLMGTSSPISFRLHRSSKDYQRW